MSEKTLGRWMLAASALSLTVSVINMQTGNVGVLTYINLFLAGFNLNGYIAIKHSRILRDTMEMYSKIHESQTKMVTSILEENIRLRKEKIMMKGGEKK